MKQDVHHGDEFEHIAHNHCEHDAETELQGTYFVGLFCQTIIDRCTIDLPICCIDFHWIGVTCIAVTALNFGAYPQVPYVVTKAVADLVEVKDSIILQ